MLLSGVLFVLFLAGCWLYCLTDAALTPAVEYRGLSKSTWIYIISATFIVGALAWLIARRSRRSKSWVTASAGYTWHSPWEADAAVARHPAGRAKQPSRDRQHVAQGPDDDPEFLRQLDRSIRGTSADPGELRAVPAAGRRATRAHARHRGHSEASAHRHSAGPGRELTGMPSHADPGQAMGDARR